MAIHAKFEKFWPNIEEDIDGYIGKNDMNQGPRFKPFLNYFSQQMDFDAKKLDFSAKKAFRSKAGSFFQKAGIVC